MITKLSQIVEEAQKKGRKRLAVAYGQDSHTLSAVESKFFHRCGIIGII